MNSFHYFNKLQYDIEKARLPITIANTIVLIGVLLMHEMIQMNAFQMIACIVLIIVYSTLHWFSNAILPTFQLLYFVIQAVIMVTCAFIVPEASPIILLGLAPLFIIQGIFYYHQKWAMVTIFALYFIVYIALMLYFFHGKYIWLLLFLVVMLFVFAHTILSLFSEQEAENLELQQANERIRELTIQNERQRMARDLHDNLAQQLVGLILKLEASEVHLTKQNYEKVDTIIHSAKEQAKQTLVEARHVIDDLRLSEPKTSFQQTICDEIKHLSFQYELQIEMNVADIVVSPAIESNVLSIVKEALTNAYKHAQATDVSVTIQHVEDHMQLVVRDNGVGIAQHDLQRKGHYGLMGIGERVALLGGTWQIQNERGTVMTIDIPL